MHSYLIIIAGVEIVRKRFALLDILHNYSFSYVDGVEEGDIYPGSYAMKHRALQYMPHVILLFVNLQVEFP